VDTSRPPDLDVVRPALWRVARVLGVTFIASAVLASTWTLVPTSAEPGQRRVRSEAILQISADPYRDAVGQHRSEVEPDTFAAGPTVVSAFQVGRAFNGGATNIGFAVSSDEGEHWTNGFLPSTTRAATPPGKYDRASDPSVAFDARHNVWLISYLGLITPDPANEVSFIVDVVVSRSTDGGHTWSAPVVVASGNPTNSLDKSWSVCDNSPSSRFYGRCYTEFDDFLRNDLMFMSTSSDGGLSWGAARTTGDPPNVFSIPPNTPGGHGSGGQPLVQPNGRVVVPYLNLDPSFFAFQIGSFISDDGGATWSPTVFVSEEDFHQPNASCGVDLAGCGLRADLPLPSAEIDGSGTIYLTWSDCRFQPSCQTSDLVLATSEDGLNWSAVQRIPISEVGSPEDHFLPGLAVDSSTGGRSADLALTYYYYPDANCTLDSCDLFVGFTSSRNGGRRWSDPVQLAGPMKLRWLPDTSQGFMVGDYVSTSLIHHADNAIPAFAVARPPGGGLLDQAIFTIAPRELRGGADNRAIEGAEGHGSPRLISSLSSPRSEEGPIGLSPRRARTRQ
jgi:hypothetical protein